MPAKEKKDRFDRWKSLMRAHLGDYEKLEERLTQTQERT